MEFVGIIYNSKYINFSISLELLARKYMIYNHNAQQHYFKKKIVVNEKNPCIQLNRHTFLFAN